MTKFDRNVDFFADSAGRPICSDFDKIIIPAKAGLVRCTHHEIYKGSVFTIL